MIRSYFLFLVLALFVSGLSEAVEPKTHLDGQSASSAGRPAAPAKPTPDEIVKKLLEQTAANQPALVGMSLTRIIDGLNHGKVEDDLFWILSDNESFPPKEMAEVYPNDKGEDWGVAASLAYTKGRKELRLKYLQEIIARLKASSDPRMKALAAAVARTIAASQDSYDRAIEQIEVEQRKVPVCFSCGEQVGIERENETEPYSFYDAMRNAADKALVDEKLMGEGGTPIFTGYLGRTSDGVTVIAEIEKAAGPSQGLIRARLTGNEEKSTAEKRAQDPAFQEAVRTFYLDHIAANDGKWPDWIKSDEQKHMINAMVNRTKKGSAEMKAVESAYALAAAARRKSPGRRKNASLAKAKDPGVKEYLETLGASHPSGLAYPKPEDMARVLKLNAPDGTSYIKYKGKGKHMEAGGEFGVEIRWDLLDKAPKAEQDRVMAILSDISENTETSDWKIVQGNLDGYCLWCNLHVNGESSRRVAAFKAKPKSR